MGEDERRHEEGQGVDVLEKEMDIRGSMRQIGVFPGAVEQFSGPGGPEDVERNQSKLSGEFVFIEIGDVVKSSITADNRLVHFGRGDFEFGGNLRRVFVDFGSHNVLE